MFSLSSPKRVAWYIIMIEKKHYEYSCEIEDFVKAHILCKLCVVLRSLVLLGVSSLRIFSRWATPLRRINSFKSFYQGQVYYSLMSLTFAFFRRRHGTMLWFRRGNEYSRTIRCML